MKEANASAALKLGLEALERLHYEMFTHQGEKAIATIKEALAQLGHDADRFCDANCTWSEHHPDCKYGTQEPACSGCGKTNTPDSQWACYCVDCWTKAEQETQAYREAAQLAKWLFKKHYAQEEHYASGRVVWGLCDTTAGVISQIDNMVCKLVLPKEPEQEPDDLTIAYMSGLSRGKDLATQRTWIDLTDEEIDDIYWQHESKLEHQVFIWPYERTIEAKLKEKNT